MISINYRAPRRCSGTKKANNKKKEFPRRIQETNNEILIDITEQKRGKEGKKRELEREKR